MLELGSSLYTITKNRTTDLNFFNYLDINNAYSECSKIMHEAIETVAPLIKYISCHKGSMDDKWVNELHQGSYTIYDP